MHLITNIGVESLKPCLGSKPVQFNILHITRKRIFQRLCNLEQHSHFIRNEESLGIRKPEHTSSCNQV